MSTPQQSFSTPADTNTATVAVGRLKSPDLSFLDDLLDGVPTSGTELPEIGLRCAHPTSHFSSVGPRDALQLFINGLPYDSEPDVLAELLSRVARRHYSIAPRQPGSWVVWLDLPVHEWGSALTYLSRTHLVRSGPRCRWDTEFNLMDAQDMARVFGGVVAHPLHVRIGPETDAPLRQAELPLAVYQRGEGMATEPVQFSSRPSRLRLQGSAPGWTNSEMRSAIRLALGQPNFNVFKVDGPNHGTFVLDCDPADVADFTKRLSCLVVSEDCCLRFLTPDEALRYAVFTRPYGASPLAPYALRVLREGYAHPSHRRGLFNTSCVRSLDPFRRADVFRIALTAPHIDSSTLAVLAAKSRILAPFCGGEGTFLVRGTSPDF